MNCKNTTFNTSELLTQHINTSHFVSEKDKNNNLKSCCIPDSQLENISINNNNNNNNNNNMCNKLQPLENSINKKVSAEKEQAKDINSDTNCNEDVLKISKEESKKLDRNLIDNEERSQKEVQSEDESKLSNETEERDNTVKVEFVDEMSTYIKALHQSVTIIDELKNFIFNPEKSLSSREQTLLLIRDKLFKFISLVKKLQSLNNQLNILLNENRVEDQVEDSNITNGHIKPLLITIYELQTQCTKYEEEIQHLTMKITELEKENNNFVNSFKKIQQFLKIDIFPFANNLRNEQQ